MTLENSVISKKRLVPLMLRAGPRRLVAYELPKGHCKIAEDGPVQRIPSQRAARVEQSAPICPTSRLRCRHRAPMHLIKGTPVGQDWSAGTRR